MRIDATLDFAAYPFERFRCPITRGIPSAELLAVELLRGWPWRPGTPDPVHCDVWRERGQTWARLSAYGAVTFYLARRLTATRTIWAPVEADAIWPAS